MLFVQKFLPAEFTFSLLKNKGGHSQHMDKAVIFDMDGVIIDSEPIHFESDKLTMRDYGHEIPDSVLERYVGIANPEMWDELRIEYGLAASVDEIIKKQMHYKGILFGGRKLEPIRGITELLHTLDRQGVRIGLASSSPREFIRLILENLGIEKYFQAVVSGEEVHKSKPEPDVFLKAAELLQIDPADCIVIEDSPYGVQASKTAGMKCIGFKNPSSGDQDLSMADFVVYGIPEAEKHIFSFITQRHG